MYLVDNLSSRVNITGRNMSVDCYVTSVAIEHYLKEQKMTIVGTMRANRKGISKELVNMQNRDDRDVKFVYANEDDMMSTSYVGKKKSGKRNILLLSAMHDDLRCSRDVRKKPNIIFYDQMKGGGNMNVFAYMLDTACTNAHTVFREIKHDICTFDFIW